MKIISYYKRDCRKETCPDGRPKTSKSPLIKEQLGRQSGGSQSTLLQLKFIRCPSMKIARFLWE